MVVAINTTTLVFNLNRPTSCRKLPVITGADSHTTSLKTAEIGFDMHLCLQQAIMH